MLFFFWEKKKEMYLRNNAKIWDILLLFWKNYLGNAATVRHSTAHEQSAWQFVFV